MPWLVKLGVSLFSVEWWFLVSDCNCLCSLSHRRVSMKLGENFQLHCWVCSEMFFLYMVVNDGSFSDTRLLMLILRDMFLEALSDTPWSFTVVVNVRASTAILVRSLTGHSVEDVPFFAIRDEKPPLNGKEENTNQPRKRRDRNRNAVSDVN